MNYVTCSTSSPLILQETGSYDLSSAEFVDILSDDQKSDFLLIYQSYIQTFRL